MGKFLTLEDVLERFIKAHGDRYSYELINNYHHQDEKLPIICKVHGIFYQSAYKHARGQGCPKCNKSHKKNTEEFVLEASRIHGDKYSYPEEYINSEKKIRIICPFHGDFFQTPHMHLTGQGCPKCYGNELKTTEQYIIECRKVHGEKYDYSKTKYKNAFGKVTITCPIHGDFVQIARVHQYGHGCPQCSGKRRFDKEFFVEKAKEIHGDLYDYTLVTNIFSNRDKVPIICKKHGVFYQAVDKHINGRQGCPKCVRSMLEEKIALLLEKHGFKYVEQKKFKWLQNLRLDFYLPDLNLAIECQGKQHFGEEWCYGYKRKSKKEEFKDILKRDITKNKLCAENKVKLLYYAETEMEYHFPYLKNEEELLMFLKEEKKKYDEEK